MNVLSKIWSRFSRKPDPVTEPTPDPNPESLAHWAAKGMFPLIITKCSDLQELSSGQYRFEVPVGFRDATCEMIGFWDCYSFSELCAVIHMKLFYTCNAPRDQETKKRVVVKVKYHKKDPQQNHNGKEKKDEPVEVRLMDENWITVRRFLRLHVTVEHISVAWCDSHDSDNEPKPEMDQQPVGRRGLGDLLRKCFKGCLKGSWKKVDELAAAERDGKWDLAPPDVLAGPKRRSTSEMALDSVAPEQDVQSPKLEC